MSSKSFTYQTIHAPSEGFFRDRGSKFLGFAYPVANREEVASRLEILRDEHPKARHFCYSFRLGAHGEDYRIADDGEPAGSAGQPIYHQLLSHELTYILVVVIRYFGGTKLGIPGLINAYKTATYEAIDQSKIETITLKASYSITTSYDHSAQLMNAFQSMNFEVVHVDYLHRVIYQLKVPLENHRALLDRSLAKGFQLPGVEMVADLEDEVLKIELIEMES